MKDEKKEKGGMDFYGIGWREGDVKRGSAWKVEGDTGDYLDAPFNHFIPDLMGTRESVMSVSSISTAIKGSIAHSISDDVLDITETKQYHVPGDDIHNDPTGVHFRRILPFSPNHRPRSDQYQGSYRVS